MTMPIRILILLLLAPSLLGCTTLHFLQQASVGQIRITRHAHPIEEVIAAPETSPRVASLLEEVPRIKQFAIEQGLEPTENYQRYTHIDGPAVVYVVNASQTLAFEPKTWTFPVVGGFSYLGWFHAKHAHAHADRLRRKGWEVYVRGASAYSTLGWFHDPILSTMLAESDDALGALVETILHESVHATVHVKSQSHFNESLAQVAGQQLAIAYLDATLGANASASIAYRSRLEREREFIDQMHHAYQTLQAVYASDASTTDRLDRKRLILAALEEDLGIDWELNNAVLMSFITYESGTGDFLRLLEATGGDWPEFFNRLSGLSSKDFHIPHMADFEEVLLPLIEAPQN